MNPNIVLIGMPGAGKSTIGVMLAKLLSKRFIDTDLLIQNRHETSLQDIIETRGYMELRRIEEDEILHMNAENSVIATGGSAVYSDTAMRHLKQDGIVLYLKNIIEELAGRIHDFETRGLAKKKEQSFYALFAEREALYRRYADITIECGKKNHQDILLEIVTAFVNAASGPS